MARVRRWLPVFGLALAVRILYWWALTRNWVPDADADQYVRLSRALANGQGFALQFPQFEVHPTAFRPPLLPFLLTPGALLFGEALWPARLLMAVIGSLVAVLAGVLAARIGGRWAGYAAAGLATLYPPLLANDTVTLTEPLALLLILAAVLLLDDGRFVGAGATIGLLLLTRPNGYVVVAILAAWAWQRAGFTKGLVVGGMAFLVLVPWLVRNQVQVGTFRPTTSDGFTIAAVWGKPAQEAGHFVDPVYSDRYQDLRHRYWQFDEAVWNDQLTKEGVQALRDHPRFLQTVVQRNAAGYFEFNSSYNRYPEVNDGRNWPFRQNTRVAFWIVSVTGLIGLVRFRRDARVIVLVLLTLQFVLVSLLLVAPPRLRAPFDLTMCIGAGLLVGSWLQGRYGRAAADARPFEEVEAAP
jgi:4-amino-4-deoxy-L-arabinose transferase-like glycosyltransferase